MLGGLSTLVVHRAGQAAYEFAGHRLVVLADDVGGGDAPPGPAPLGPADWRKRAHPYAWVM